MKFAVSSMSSTASRNPPSVMRGMSDVAARPIGFWRRSSILPAPLLRLRGWRELIQDHARELLLRRSEGSDDVFHRLVDVEVDGQDRDDAIGEVEQLAVGGFPRQRRAVENDEVVTPG